MELDAKTGIGILLALLGSGGLGVLGTDQYNESSHLAELEASEKRFELELAADQKRDETQIAKVQDLLDRNAQECAAARQTQGEANQVVVSGLMELLRQ